MCGAGRQRSDAPLRGLTAREALGAQVERTAVKKTAEDARREMDLTRTSIGDRISLMYLRGTHVGEVRVVTVIRTDERPTGTILVAKTQSGKVRDYWPSLTRKAQYLGPLPDWLLTDEGGEFHSP